MEGVIVNFRRGRHRTSKNQMILQVAGVDSKEKAAKLTGKMVEWVSVGGKKIPGKVTGPHGCRGAVKARFDTGMPGQAVGTKVKII